MSSEHALLSIWEQSRGSRGAAWAVALIAAVFPHLPKDAIWGLTVVQRDRLLLQLRCLLFGTTFDCSASCPGCGECLEWQSSAADLDLIADSPMDLGGASSSLHRLSVRGALVVFREPTSADLERVRGAADADRALLRACLLVVEHGGVVIAADGVTDAVLEQVAGALQARAEETLPSFDLACPNCATRFSRALDIAVYLNDEISRWARQLLDTVHRLATAYGWTESEVLAIPPARRSDYLALANR